MPSLTKNLRNRNWLMECRCPFKYCCSCTLQILLQLKDKHFINPLLWYATIHQLMQMQSTYLIWTYFCKTKFLCPDGFSFVGRWKNKMLDFQSYQQSFYATKERLEVSLIKIKNISISNEMMNDCKTRTKQHHKGNFWQDHNPDQIFHQNTKLSI